MNDPKWIPANEPQTQVLCKKWCDTYHYDIWVAGFFIIQNTNNG